MKLKPLVLAQDPTSLTKEVGLQQLQQGNDLDIPLDGRFQALQKNYCSLLLLLAEVGIELNQEQTDYLEENYDS